MANFNITYNKLTQYFEHFASGHTMVQRFASGFRFDLNSFARNENNWPLMYMEFISATPKEQTKEYRLKFYVLDLKQKATINKEVSNEGEVVSDTDMILDHLRKYIQSDVTNNIKVVGDSEHRPLTNYSTEYCAGVSTELTIKVPFNLENCDIPFSGGTNVNYITL